MLNLPSAGIEESEQLATIREQVELMLERQEFDQVIILARQLEQHKNLAPVFACWLMRQAESWHSLGFVQQQWQMSELLAPYIPDGWKIYHGLGVRAQMLGDFKAAQIYYERVLEFQPDYPFSRVMLGQLRMMESGFKQGRDLYEARFDAQNDPNAPDFRHFPAARWRGESLRGKSIYLWAEQGIGDMVMFAGFLPALIAQKPKRIVLGVLPKLVSLFKRSFPSITVEPLDRIQQHIVAPVILETYPNIMKLQAHTQSHVSLQPMQQAYDQAREQGLFDYAAPMGDMMVHLMPEVKPTNYPSGYLKADPVRTAGIRENLSSIGKARRIGISWFSSNSQDGLIRKISLEQLEPILRIPNCYFFALQHHVPAIEIEQFNEKSGCQVIVDPGFDPVEDIEGLAALMASMDEVISIDNSTIHLAGALDIPSTLLLPKGYNYRWPMQKDGGTLWYKHVHIECQHEVGDWQPAIKRVVSALKKRVSQ